ncbi:MAG: aromatic ring-hydroxylating dioxygenase subunit alpha [Alphaproteobacteria bacterium]|nr:aromatic ring-hydroxylating dioxygenase subunit alpha [Alphaproteobacteria bacterium]
MSVHASDIFDPAHYEKVRLPLEEAETLPPWAYTSEAFYRREVETIFTRSWYAVGRVERLPEPGDYFSVDVTGIPIIIVRGLDGTLRALSNSCRHRGAKMLEGSGNTRSFRCPYHSWTYDTAGCLRGAGGMENIKGFELADYGLPEVRLETWGGFIFVNFDRDAVGLREWLGDLDERVGSYGLADLRCTRTIERVVACNWKVYMENAMEEYHLPTVHRATISKLKMKHREEGGKGQYCVIVEEHEGTRAVLPGETGFPFIPTLTGAAAKGTHYVQIYPNLNFAATKDCVFFLEIHPLGVDRTRLALTSMFPQSTIARPDFAEVVERYYRRLDKSAPEDFVIAEVQQRGLSSPLARAGRLSLQEPLVHHIANWVLDRVIGPAPRAVRAVA